MTNTVTQDRIWKEVPDMRKVCEDGDRDLDDLPVNIGFYSQHELAFGDIVRSIFDALTKT